MAEVVERNARYLALWTSRTSFVLSPFIWFGVERGTAEFQFVEDIVLARVVLDRPHTLTLLGNDMEQNWSLEMLDIL